MSEDNAKLCAYGIMGLLLVLLFVCPPLVILAAVAYCLVNGFPMGEKQ